jgi:hypothetical protein
MEEIRFYPPKLYILYDGKRSQYLNRIQFGLAIEQKERAEDQYECAFTPIKEILYQKQVFLMVIQSDLEPKI